MQGFNYNLPKDSTAKIQNVKDEKSKWPLNIKTAPSVDTLLIFFNGHPPPPLHLQSMVGRNDLLSGYKSQRTKGHKGTRKSQMERLKKPGENWKKEQIRGQEKKKKN